jgi:hypothetical protein
MKIAAKIVRTQKALILIKPKLPRGRDGKPRISVTRESRVAEETGSPAM